MTIDDAKRKIQERDDLEKALLEKRKSTLLRVTRNKIKNSYHKQGVLARRWERERRKLLQDAWAIRTSCAL